MKTTFYLLPTRRSFRLLLALMGMGLLASSPLYAQNYNAGVGSGTGGSGNQNVFVGPYAGSSNTTGNSNSFVGTYAGFSNTTGNYNSFLGTNAGYFNTTGFSNSFLGFQSGTSNTEGNDNSFVGIQAGYYNTTGSNSSFVGSAAGFSNTTGSWNSFVGQEAGYANTTGANNSSLGRNAGSSNTTGSHNLFLGAFANPSSGALSNAGAIGSQALVSASNSLVLGSINGVNGATASTNVGIGTTAPAYLLHVNGKAAKPGSPVWTVASDQRLKKNVSAFTDGLEVLTKVKPVWFEYNGKAGMPTNKKYVGVIAQQMQQIAPYMVGRFTDQDTPSQKTDYLDYDANALTYILVNAVQEQQKQIGALQAQIAQLLSQQPGNSSLKTAGEGGAQLWQNVPNPTEGTTLIRYSIPAQAHQAQISLHSLKGELLKSFPITQRGAGELSVNTTTLPEGVYLYRLVIDGKQVDTKKLLRQN